MADTQTGRLPKLGERLNGAAAARSTAESGTLTCQWCSVTLPPGETICSTCGSPGVPDTSMIVPDSEVKPASNAVSDVLVPTKDDDELVEWWNEGEKAQKYENSAAGNDDPLPVILGLVGTGIICILLGVFAAPIVLASVFENSLGVTVENANDLRPLGGVIGLLIGAFIGAIGMWVTAPRR